MPHTRTPRPRHNTTWVSEWRRRRIGNNNSDTLSHLSHTHTLKKTRTDQKTNVFCEKGDIINPNIMTANRVLCCSRYSITSSLANSSLSLPPHASACHFPLTLASVTQPKTPPPNNARRTPPSSPITRPIFLPSTSSSDGRSPSLSPTKKERPRSRVLFFKKNTHSNLL